MSALAAIASASMVAQTLRMAVPYTCAALGGVWSERSGVVNIALEGILLGSGLGAVVVHLATGSPVLGLLAGAATGAAIGLLHAALCVLGRVNAIVSGIAINLAAAGATRFLLRALYDSSANSPSIDGFDAHPEGRAATGGGLLTRTLTDPMLVLALGLLVTTWLVLYRTKLGLRVRASGEDPAAAATLGISVAKVRIAAVTIGGAICGLGGVALAYDQHVFQSGMSGARGFIALAAVILSGWRPGRAALACVVFAALDALQVVLQGQVALSPYVLQMLPYVATIVALFVIAWRRTQSAGPPAGLGRHVE